MRRLDGIVNGPGPFGLKLHRHRGVVNEGKNRTKSSLASLWVASQTLIFRTAILSK